jgi:4-hydroxybenzoate polyprenyltransferase
MSYIKTILIQLRIQQYVKNFFIFLPLFFAMRLSESSLVINAAIAFIAFSLVASAIYTLNDYRDIEDDRLHPEKRNRPLASGAISKFQAFVMIGVLIVAGFAIMTTLSLEAAGILASYVLLNIAYSIRLKHIAILDIVIIAVGFVIRLFIGSSVTDVPLSTWIVVMTFLLALFLALAKRRDDVLIYLDTGKKLRKAINGYNLQFLDISMSIMASVVIVAYISYSTSQEVIQRIHNNLLYLTSLFVIMGIMRYLQIAFVQKESGSPTKIVLKDRFMQLILIGWVLTFAWILYI